MDFKNIQEIMFKNWQLQATSDMNKRLRFFNRIVFEKNCHPPRVCQYFSKTTKTKNFFFIIFKFFPGAWHCLFLEKICKKYLIKLIKNGYQKCRQNSSRFSHKPAHTQRTQRNSYRTILPGRGVHYESYWSRESFYSSYFLVPYSIFLSPNIQFHLFCNHKFLRLYTIKYWFFIKIFTFYSKIEEKDY